MQGKVATSGCPDASQNFFSLESSGIRDFAEHSDREVLIEFQKLGLKVFRPPRGPEGTQGWSPVLQR